MYDCDCDYECGWLSSAEVVVQIKSDGELRVAQDDYVGGDVEVGCKFRIQVRSAAVAHQQAVEARTQSLVSDLP